MNTLTNKVKSLKYWLLPIIIFIVLLLFPTPRSIGKVFRYGLTTTILILFVLYYLSSLLPGNWKYYVSFTIIFAAFALSLNGLWSSGYTETNVNFGLLPTYDAQAYYHDSLQFLEGNSLSTMTSRRPIFTIFSSTLMFITGRNLQAVLAILLFISTISCTIFINISRKILGVIPSATIFIILFMYYRTFTGKLLTEHLGLTFGALGFALLLQGAHEHKKLETLLGILVVTLGMMIRPGTLFIIPLLAIWAGIAFRKKYFMSYNMLALSVLIIFGGLLINMSVFHFSADAQAKPFSNFSFTFYGITKGGEEWTSFYKDHPEAVGIGEPEISQLAYKYAFEEIADNPKLFLSGIIKGWAEFVKAPDGVFSFISYRSQGWSNVRSIGGLNISPFLIIRTFVFSLSIIGILSLFFEKNKVISLFLFLMLFGIVISIPFAPPRDAGFRIYAVSIPLIALYPAYGLHMLFSKINFLKFLNPKNHAAAISGIPFSIILVIYVILSPIFIRAMASAPIYQDFDCQENENKAVLRLDTGSYVIIHGDTDKQTWLPYINVGDFIIGNHNWSTSDMTDFFDNLPTPTLIAHSYDENRNNFWLVLPIDENFNINNELLYLCGNKTKINYNDIFIADRMINFTVQ